MKTNRELVRELPDRGAPEPVSRRAGELFGWYDRTFYSLAPVSPDEARRFISEVEAFGRELEAAS